jgi:uncharacterized protein (DUF1015 family)
MVAISPFRALRYNLDKVGSLSSVIAPPYDVISPEAQERLYRASPYNVVRLILGKQSAEDTQTDNRYTRAKKTFDEWIKEKIIVQDPKGAIYLYEHSFSWQGRVLSRLGFVAQLDFEGSVPGKVLAHESTFQEPKTDRAHLVDAVRANLSPVFCVVPDSDAKVFSLLDGWRSSRKPLAETVISETKESIRVWAVDDKESIGRLKSALASHAVLIADGHHRFAVAFSKKELHPGVMTYFSCLADPALVMRPIQRVVKRASSMLSTWASALNSLCEVVELGSLKEVNEWLGKSDAPGLFGYFEKGRFYRLEVRREVIANWLMHPSVALPLASLDVSILHQLMLPRLASYEGADGGSVSYSLCSYTPDSQEAVGMTEKDPALNCAFILRPISLSVVFSIASQGLTLPQKSTYFYPKVLSGLFINRFSSDAS